MNLEVKVDHRRFGELDPVRLKSLDSMRGLAALLVVVYHFQHLAAVGQDPASWTVEAFSLPFYAILKPVYLHGWMAVDLFFAISGFVFFWLYREAIHERRIDASSFIVLRLTRLYPLHALTLMLVAGLQAAYGAAMGSFFIIPYNDIGHFALNLLFLQSWSLERGPSFNAASWSISIEILLYLIFFLFSLSRLSRSASALLGAVCIGILAQGVNSVIGRGIAGFFAGGLAFNALSAVSRRPNADAIARRAIASAAALWLVALVAVYADALDRLSLFLHPGPAAKIGSRFVLYGLFPLTVFALAASERILGRNWSATSVLGDLSYAAYLMHFPLQLVLANLVAWGLLREASIIGGAGLFGFFTILIPLSWLTYQYFELPMQRLGRRWLLGRRERFA